MNMVPPGTVDRKIGTTLSTVPSGGSKTWHTFTDQLEHVLSGVLDILCRSAAGLLHYLPDAAADLVAQALRIAELGSLELKTGALKTLAALASYDPGTMFCDVVSCSTLDEHQFAASSRNLKPIILAACVGMSACILTYA